MLVAVLNTCSKEELEESDDESLVSPTALPGDHLERRKVIKNKILAVGRMARVFALLRLVVFLVNIALWLMHRIVRNLKKFPS